MLGGFTLILILPGAAAYTFRMMLLAPLTGSRRMGETEIQAVVNVTLEKVLQDKTLSGLHGGNHSIEFVIEDTECDRGAGVFKFVETVKHNTSSRYIHAVIGPSCDNVCESVGLLAGRWHMPVISFGCFSDDLSDRTEYPTLLRMTGSFIEVGAFLSSTMTYFRWERITLIVGGESAWLRAAEDILLGFRKSGVLSRRLQLNDVENLTEAFTIEAQHTRVFFLLAYGQDVHHIMLSAYHAGLINGRFVFLAVDYENMAMRIKHSYNSTVPYAEVFSGMFDVTVDVHPESEEFQEFLKRVEIFKGNNSNPSNYEDSIQMALVADAVYLYVHALNNCIVNGGLCPRGKDIAAYLYGIKRQGVAGNLEVNRDGSRHVGYMLHNIRGNRYAPVARSKHGGAGFKILGNVDEIVWPGGSTQVPDSAPQCGWDGELCIRDDTPVIVGSLVAAVLIVALVALVGFILWKRKLEKVRLEREDWRIHKDDISPVSVQKSVYSIMTGSNYGKSESSSYVYSTPDVKQSGSLMSVSRNLNSTLSERASLAMYDNQKVVLKSVSAQHIAVTKQVIVEINAIRLLSHPNVNTLIGAFVEPESNGLVWSYCTRGSMQDILLAEEIKLDWLFKISFATDIAKAMIYIHSSLVETHGNLKSTNILIDSHWVCKVGDFAMPRFKENESETERTLSKYFRYLWTAPEILRDTVNNHKGTQKGDVFSFAIIIQELLTRTMPYGSVLHDCYDDVTIEQILNRVKNVEIPPYRPNVPHTVKEEGLLSDVMRLCWDELSVNRPSFKNILHLLTVLNKRRKTNILDQMMHRMTKYSEQLEHMIQERTLMLNEEKKKTEQILSKMLPKAVIEDLKLGKSIEPESFPSVTVFFSDVVDFTKLAAESTPYQVVNFLNNLYTMFDYVIDHFDVYKVETIGDAYMVVSGLPVRNGIEHAGHICSMSLQLLSSVDKFKIAHRPNMKLKLRIGVHSGPVVAGVVGQTMPRYCLFGDTVNYASRMESTGEALRIHVSPECKELLDELGGYQFQERGEINMKGKGTIMTYFLTGKEGFVDSISASEINSSIHDHRFQTDFPSGESDLSTGSNVWTRYR